MNNSRALIVIVFIFLFFTALVIKLFDIQIVKSEELKYYAQKQQTKVEKIEADRGLIYDRNNTLLVYNRNDVSFYLDLRMVSGSGKIKIAKKVSLKPEIIAMTIGTAVINRTRTTTASNGFLRRASANIFPTSLKTLKELDLELEFLNLSVMVRKMLRVTAPLCAPLLYHYYLGKEQ